MSKCLLCKEGVIVQKDPSFEWYECNNCGVDDNELVDGYLYPMRRRGTMCTMYTPVHDLNVEHIGSGETIEFLTSRKTRKSATVIHVDKSGNQMIIEDVDTKKIRFVIPYEDIADAYDALFADNKRKFAGWWNRKIEILVD